jgi:hypothetical protein
LSSTVAVEQKHCKRKKDDTKSKEQAKLVRFLHVFNLKEGNIRHDYKVTTVQEKQNKRYNLEGLVKLANVIFPIKTRVSGLLHVNIDGRESKHNPNTKA